MVYNTAVMGKDTRQRLILMATWLLAATAVAAALWFLVLSISRVFYPYDLDFIEDAMLMQAWRTAQGLPVYLPPNAEFVPQVYMPLTTWLGGLLLRLTGPAFWPLRLLSLGSTLATAVLLTTIARREQARWAVALACGGLYLAGYKLLGGWLDLVRVDALFALLVLAGMATAVYGHDSRRGLLLAGLLMGLSFLTKQNGLFLGVAVGGWLLLVGGWRVGWYALAFGLGTAVPILWMQATTDGWFGTYVFGIAYASPVALGRLWHNMSREILVAMGGLVTTAVLAAVHLLQTHSPLRRRPLLRSARFGWLLFVGAAVFVSVAGRASVGGNLNNLIVGYALLCLSPGLLGKRWQTAVVPLALLQFGLSLTPVLPYAPKQYWPTAEMRQQGDALVAYLRAVDGEVLVMLHPHYAQLAGKTADVHMQTLWHARWRGAEPLPADFVARIENQAYAVIISDESIFFETEPKLVALLNAHYVAEPLPEALSPPTLSGLVTRPLRLYTPIPNP